jgi:hypothetical protein
MVVTILIRDRQNVVPYDKLKSKWALSPEFSTYIISTEMQFFLIFLPLHTWRQKQRFQFGGHDFHWFQFGRCRIKMMATILIQIHELKSFLLFFASFWFQCVLIKERKTASIVISYHGRQGGFFDPFSNAREKSFVWNVDAVSNWESNWHVPPQACFVEDMLARWRFWKVNLIE